jgi:hypothetical protein
VVAEGTMVLRLETALSGVEEKGRAFSGGGAGPN